MVVEVERPDCLVPFAPFCAAALRCSAVEGLGGPKPSILRESSKSPCRAAPTTSSSSLGATSASINSGNDVEVAGVCQRPGGDPAHARRLCRTASCGIAP